MAKNEKEKIIVEEAAMHKGTKRREERLMVPCF